MERLFVNLEAQLPLLVSAWKDIALAWDKAGQLLQEAGFEWPELAKVADAWKPSCGRDFFRSIPYLHDAAVSSCHQE